MMPETAINAMNTYKSLWEGIRNSRTTAYPEITPKMEFCPDWRQSGRNLRFMLQTIHFGLLL